MIRRADDNPETLRKRLATYHKQTSPLIDFYRQRRLLRTVDASLDSTTIFERINKIFEDMKSTSPYCSTVMSLRQIPTAPLIVNRLMWIINTYLRTRTFRVQCNGFTGP